MFRQHPLIREGLIAGALGASVVAVWFLLLDLAHGRVFFTPAALGSAFFYGASGMDQVRRTAPVILGYTFIHIVAFMAVGFLAARIMTSADKEPRILLGAAVLFVTLEVAVLCVLAFAAGWLLDALALWTVLVANALAALVIGYYLYLRHPQVGANLRTNLEDRDLEND